MDDIDKDTQRQILEAERDRWRNELELMRIRSRVADAIDDKAMKEQVKAHAEKCVKAIEEIEKMMSE